MRCTARITDSSRVLDAFCGSAQRVGTAGSRVLVAESAAATLLPAHPNLGKLCSTTMGLLLQGGWPRTYRGLEPTHLRLEREGFWVGVIRPPAVQSGIGVRGLGAQGSMSQAVIGSTVYRSSVLDSKGMS